MTRTSPFFPESLVLQVLSMAINLHYFQLMKVPLSSRREFMWKIVVIDFYLHIIDQSFRVDQRQRQTESERDGPRERDIKP